MRKVTLTVLILGVVVGFFLRDLFREKPVAAKIVTIKNRNLDYQVATKANTVGELLLEQGFAKEDRDDGIVSGMTIDIREPVNITLVDGGNSREIQTFAETVGDLLNIEKIGLAPTDQVTPGLHDFLGEKTEVVIDRIVDLEILEANKIPFAVEILQDSEIFYGRQQIQRLGEDGKKEQIFLITYKNGIEIHRKLLSEKIVKQPVSEIRKLGTKIEVEAQQEGRASWYATKVCLSALGGCAAHPSYAFGRFVRVTSLSTGKSVIVRINDRGPDQSIHPDRVIDLDLTAFKQLAPLGAGTIAVKVELLRSN